MHGPRENYEGFGKAAGKAFGYWASSLPEVLRTLARPSFLCVKILLLRPSESVDERL